VSAAVTPLGVHHVSINVHDTAASVAFYTEMLGLATRADRPDFAFGGAWLDIGGQQVHLIESAVPDNCGQHFAIHIADIDAAVAELRERGVEVSDPKPVASSRQCFLHDPSGNLIELHEPGVTSGV
jgi:catechol 2,3-dioxygenase-like lactoylglutathione lyase family enzyme